MGVERELAGARMDAAVCKSLVDSTSELRRRAMRAMRSVTDAGVDALREAEAAAVDAARVVFDSAKTETETVAKTAAKTVELKPGEVEDIAERAFGLALARETARRVAVVVCGPMWLGATQADFTSMAAGAMSVYACNQSMSLFLPGSSCRGESAEDAAARRALTPSDGAVELSLDVDLDDDDDENFGADENPRRSSPPPSAQGEGHASTRPGRRRRHGRGQPADQRDAKGSGRGGSVHNLGRRRRGARDDGRGSRGGSGHRRGWQKHRGRGRVDRRVRHVRRVEPRVVVGE